jgi:allantoinase
MTSDLVVYGRLVLPTQVIDGGLHIHCGKIVGLVTDSSETIPGATIVDHRGKYILPGLIEVHGHMREPGLGHKEDYITGTRAALAGGVTTILDMPNTEPPTTTRQRLNEKATIAAGRAYTDYAFFFGGARDNQHEIAALDPREVVGVKFFMAGHETTPTTVSDVGDLYAGLEAMQGKQLVALFHAENQALINRRSAVARAAGRTDGRAYSEIRGPITAQAAVAEALVLAASLRVPAYICHISTAAEVALIDDFKDRGAAAYAEVVGYHLTFSVDDYERLGTLIKVSPPIRELGEVDQLWMALALDRSIDTLASEHSPHTYAEKDRPMLDAVSGTPGIQENLPMVITQYRARFPEKPLDLIMAHVARLGATNVARIFGLATKGVLDAGKSADFTVIDPSQTWTLDPHDLLTKSGWSPYTGRTMTCRVVATYLHGERVYEPEEAFGDPRGQRLYRDVSPGA